MEMYTVVHIEKGDPTANVPEYSVLLLDDDDEPCLFYNKDKAKRFAQRQKDEYRMNARVFQLVEL